MKREIIREVLDIWLKPPNPNRMAFGMHRLNLRWRWEATEQPESADADRRPMVETAAHVPVRKRKQVAARR